MSLKGPLPRIHPSSTLCRALECELRNQVHVLMERYSDKLSYLELARCVWNVGNETMSQYVKRSIRLERHGDTETPGDLA